MQCLDYTDWRLLGVPATGDTFELARYPHQEACLQARAASMLQAWTEKDQVPSLVCDVTEGWWTRCARAYAGVSSQRKSEQFSKPDSTAPPQSTAPDLTGKSFDELLDMYQKAKEK
jgi:hypothetical protein